MGILSWPKGLVLGPCPGAIPGECGGCFDDDGPGLMSWRCLEPWLSTLIGTKSLMVMQMVHLKTFNSLGHFTSEAHVIQLPVAKSLLMEGFPRLCVCTGLLLGAGPPVALSTSTEGFEAEPCLLRPLKSDGNGLLMEREWFGWRPRFCCEDDSALASPSESEELRFGFTRAWVVLDLASRRVSETGVSRASECSRLMRSVSSRGVNSDPRRAVGVGVGYGGAISAVAEAAMIRCSYLWRLRATMAAASVSGEGRRRRRLKERTYDLLPVTARHVQVALQAYEHKAYEAQHKGAGTGRPPAHRDGR